jgi:hypothetical protein
VFSCAAQSPVVFGSWRLFRVSAWTGCLRTACDRVGVLGRREGKEGVKPAAALDKTGAESLSQYTRVEEKDSVGVSSVLKFSVPFGLNRLFSLHFLIRRVLSIFRLFKFLSSSTPLPPFPLECCRAGSAPRCPCESPVRAVDWLHSACRSFPCNLA